jgi:sarcosine oxidase
MPDFDIIIIGAGAFGSSTAYYLSKSGKKVLVLDRFNPPHDKGSSHGQTRVIREAYFENPIYVPLLQRSYQLWENLEMASGKELLIKTGGLMLGKRDSHVVTGTLESAHINNLSCELLNDEEITNQFPAFNPTKGTYGVYEKNAGILFPERCIDTYLSLAQNEKTTYKFEEVVTKVEHNEDKIKVVTNKAIYTSNKIIISTGAWINELIADLDIPLQVSRQVLFWFTLHTEKPESFSIPNFPIYIWNTDNNEHFYGFPDIGNGFKIALHDKGENADPNTLNREVTNLEINNMNSLIKLYFNTESTYINSSVCMYTNTPDDDFIIDYHPSNKNIIIASPCSGHGFKFSSVIGEILSDMATEKQIEFDLYPFRLSRFK